MLKTPFHTYRSEATDLAEGGGGKAPDKGENKAEGSPLQEKQEAAPNWLDNAMAAARSKGALQKENASLKAKVKDLEPKLAKAQEEITQLKAEQNKLREAFEAAQEEAQTVSDAVTEELAAVGVDVKQAPPVAQGKAKGSVEELTERMAATTDPTEKFRLADQIWEAMQKQS
ncbi:MAG: hypothetical protein AB7I98_03850 [Verrucomicrobiales bacterium]